MISSPELLIPPTDFIQVSEAHFGTPVYGQSVTNLLQNIRSAADSSREVPELFVESELATGPVTYQSLAKYVWWSGLARHELTGATGKMADVAGGALKAPRTVEQGKALISRNLFVDCMEAFQLSADNVKAIRLATRANVQRQLCTGRGPESGAVVIEGLTRFLHAPFNVVFDRIAPATIPFLLDELPKKTSNRARVFLQSFS